MCVVVDRVAPRGGAGTLRRKTTISCADGWKVSVALKRRTVQVMARRAG